MTYPHNTLKTFKSSSKRKMHSLYSPYVKSENGIVVEVKWYINGYDVTIEITKWAKERDIDLDNLTDEDKMIIMIEWGNYGK